MTRAQFLSDQIGRPWDWQQLNCWSFAALVQRELFNRMLPHVELPAEPSWRWMLRAVGSHPEHANWSEVAEGPHGLVAAADGALCLMGRSDGPGHIGTWLAAETGVIHCDRESGVVLHSTLALKQIGWRKLRFFEPNP
jgi:hypothetical protein